MKTVTIYDWRQGETWLERLERQRRNEERLTKLGRVLCGALAIVGAWTFVAMLVGAWH